MATSRQKRNHFRSVSSHKMVQGTVGPNKAVRQSCARKWVYASSIQSSTQLPLLVDVHKTALGSMVFLVSLHPEYVCRHMYINVVYIYAKWVVFLKNSNIGWWRVMTSWGVSFASTSFFFQSEAVVLAICYILEIKSLICVLFVACWS